MTPELIASAVPWWIAGFVGVGIILAIAAVGEWRRSS